VNDYVNGDTYIIAVDINGAPIGGCYGFQMLNIDASGETRGTFNSAAGTKIISSGLRTYIEHSSTSNSGNWSFTWTAPDVEAGTINWYLGATVANCDGTSFGDAIYTASASLQGPNCPVGYNMMSLQDNTIFYECDYTSDQPRLKVQFTNFSGPGAPYTLSSNGGELSSTIAYPGDIIDYFFTENELNNGMTIVTIDNGMGVCAPSDSINFAFEGYPIDNFCSGSPQCFANIIATYPKNNNSEPVLTCTSGNNFLELQVTSVSGGTGIYYLSSPGGILSASTLFSGQGFSYYISQADINNYNAVISITDNNGCTSKIDLRGYLKNLQIGNYCSSCDDTIVENTQSQITSDESANITIISNGFVASNSSIEYSAGTCIELAPAFEVKLGAEFDAIIGPCN